MSHKNKESLTRQIENKYTAKLAIGESKYAAKLEHTANDKIFSWSTFQSYMREANKFASYCRENYGCRTLEQCQQYANEWMQTRSALSPYTQKLDACALGKLYGIKSSEFKTPDRTRDGITRSRHEVKSDKHFSERNNSQFVHFCKMTGLRKSEIQRLRPEQLRIDKNGNYCLEIKGKGGRVRVAPILNNDKTVVDRIKSTIPGQKVWCYVPKAADVHSYRSEYATTLYRQKARPLEVCKNTPFYNKEHYNGYGMPKGGFDRDSVYHLRGSHKGEWLDKAAMLEVSNALGHDRISVCGEHYIR